jgi:hypothetical protein
MQDLLVKMEVNAGILEGMDPETAKIKAEDGEKLIYDLEERECSFLFPKRGR